MLPLFISSLEFARCGRTEWTKGAQLNTPTGVQAEVKRSKEPRSFRATIIDDGYKRGKNYETQDDVLLEKGRNIHKFIEMYIRDKVELTEVETEFPVEVSRFKTFYSDFEPLLFQKSVHGVEIFLENKMFSGVIDCICADVFGQVYILEWKTSATKPETFDLKKCGAQLIRYKSLVESKMGLEVAFMLIVRFTGQEKRYKIFSIADQPFYRELLRNFAGEVSLLGSDNEEEAIDGYAA